VNVRASASVFFCSAENKHPKEAFKEMHVTDYVTAQAKCRLNVLRWAPRRLPLIRHMHSIIYQENPNRRTRG
jgi:hypothetical protein